MTIRSLNRQLATAFSTIGAKFVQPLLCLVAVLLLCLAAVPGQSVSAQQSCTPKVITGSGSDEDVRVQVILDKMRGHLLVSMQLWQSSDYMNSVMHASHPAGELLTVIATDLRGACLLSDISKALSAHVAVMSAAGDKAAAEKSLATVNGLLDEAGKRLAPAAAVADPVFNFRVVAGVLIDSKQEYSEGYKDGKIVKPVDYQDGMGFFLAAQARYNTIKGKFPPAAVQAAAAAESAWKTLSADYPTVVPPEKPADPAAVAAAVDATTVELAKALGVSLEAKLTPIEYLNNTRDAIAEAQSAYEAGKQDDAYEEAASAYLDQYENVEGTLSAKDKTLMVTLETQLKAYRDAIKAGKPAAELKTLLNQINANLDKAIATLNQ